MNYRLFLYALLSIMLVGCGEEQVVQQLGKYRCMKVDTTTALMSKDFAATIESEDEVYVYPLATGYVVQKFVEDGEYVKKGQIIMQLDARELKANVDAAASQVNTFQAELAKATLEVKKLKPLVDKGIISEYELESAITTERSYRERLDVAKSQLKTAEINYNYATIRAPQSGYISSIKQKVGELVMSGNVTPITKIAGTGTYRAYFTIPEDNLRVLAKTFETSDLRSLLEPMNKYLSFTLITADGDEFKNKGKLQLGSSIVESSTGTLRFRAVFHDEDNNLFSGSSGRVRVEYKEPEAILIPESASYEIQDKHMIYVLDDNNTVQTRSIEVERASGKQYIVYSGLEKGDVILLEGIGTLQSGTVIEPVFE